MDLTNSEYKILKYIFDNTQGKKLFRYQLLGKYKDNAKLTSLLIKNLSNRQLVFDSHANGTVSITAGGIKELEDFEALAEEKESLRKTNEAMVRTNDAIARTGEKLVAENKSTNFKLIVVGIVAPILGAIAANLLSYENILTVINNIRQLLNF